MDVRTDNEFIIGSGENLPNHSASLAGKGRFVRQMVPDVPTFRTQQEAFRYAAYIITLAENWLPHDAGCEEQSFEVVLNAIRNT